MYLLAAYPFHTHGSTVDTQRVSSGWVTCDTCLMVVNPASDSDRCCARAHGDTEGGPKSGWMGVREALMKSGRGEPGFGSRELGEPKRPRREVCSREEGHLGEGLGACWTVPVQCRGLQGPRVATEEGAWWPGIES